MADWTIRAQTVHARGDLTLDFRLMGTEKQRRVLDITVGGRRWMVRFSASGHVVHIEQAPLGLPKPDRPGM